MAKILEDIVKNNINHNAFNIRVLYDVQTADNFIGGRLIEKQNDFNDFLQQLEEKSMEKNGKDAINMMPETVKAIKNYALELAKNMDSSNEKNLFLHFAEARGSQTLTLIKKISDNKALEYKKNETLVYCAFLLKSSKDLYTDPRILSENIEYYAGYIRLLPEYKGINTYNVALEAIYSSAIQGALENQDAATAKAYLSDKSIASNFSTSKLTEFITKIEKIEQENMENAIASKINPASKEDLDKYIKDINETCKKGLLNEKSCKKIVDEIKLIFNINCKNKNEIQKNSIEKTVQNLISKIITSQINAKDIINSDLPQTIKDLISKVIETENEKNTEKVRNHKKLTLEKIINAIKKGEVISLEDVAEKYDGFLDTPGLLNILHGLKEQQNNKYVFKETI